MDAARSAPQGAHYHAGVIYLGAWDLWFSGLGLHQLGSRPPCGEFSCRRMINMTNLFSPPLDHLPPSEAQ